VIHAFRPFLNATLFSGVMSLGAFAGAAARDDDAFAVLGCALACQGAVLLAAGLCAKPGETFWTKTRILAVCAPSYGAAALGFGLALDRGLAARHTLDLAVFGVILAFQGRMFAAHIAGTDRRPEPALATSMRARLVVPLDGQTPRLRD
jgi:hypothetical protein